MYYQQLITERVYMVNTKAQVGIYKLTHTPTGKFYIGATTNLYKRWHSHKSRFTRGKHHAPLQLTYDLTNDITDWSIKLVKTCIKKTLVKNEQVYLTQYKNNPKCINTHSKANVGRRDKKINDVSRYHLASAMLGKNSRKGNILRPNNLTFVAPDGTEYPNVQSVNRFAEEHTLSQVQMNYVANGELNTFCGWTRKDSELPLAASVQEYWSRERMLQNYPEYVIIAPDGSEHRTWVVYQFEQTHGCSVVSKPFSSRTGVKSHVNGLDALGRGYRLQHVPYFDVTYDGKTYHNILSLAKWAAAVGIRAKRLQYLLRRPPFNQIRKTVRTIELQIKKVISESN